MNENWCVLQIKPKHQDLFECAIVGILGGVYNPRYEMEINNPYKRHTRPAHLFPGYIFAAGSFESAVIKLRSVNDPRLHRPINVGMITLEEIELMRAREDSRGLIVTEKRVVYSNRFLPGERVEVVDVASPYYGKFATVERVFDANLPTEQRIGILLESAAVRFSAQIPASSLMKVAVA